MSFEIWREFVENANRSVRKKNFSESGPASRRRLRRNWGDKEEYLKEPERRSRGAEDTGRCQNNAERGSDTMHSQRTTRDLINNYANISDLVNRMMNRRKSELFQKYNIDLKVKQEPPRQFWSTENLSPELDEKIEQQNVRLVRERSLERPGNPVSKSTSFLDKEKDPTKTKFRVRLRKKAPKKPDSARQRKRLVVVSKPFRTNLPDEIFPRKMTPEAVPTSPMVVISRSRLQEDPFIIMTASLSADKESSTDPKITDLFQYSRLSSRSTNHQFFRNQLPSSHRNRPPKRLYQLHQTLSSSPLRDPDSRKGPPKNLTPKISTNKKINRKSRQMMINHEKAKALPPLENEPVMKIVIKKKRS